MSLFSIADLHLSLTSNKPMDKFGARWTDYMTKIDKRWRAVVSDSDTVVVAGDISWAIDLEEAKDDFRFIESLPGRKIIGKGNHDYWWSTLSKLEIFKEENGFKSIDFLFNNAIETEDYIIAGTRGWYIEEKLQLKETADYEKIIARENGRLLRSLQEAEKLSEFTGKPILVYFHFPPVFGDFRCGEFIETMKEFKVTHCYFGHIHGNYRVPRTTETDGITMSLISADFLDFIPMITMPIDY